MGERNSIESTIGQEQEHQSLPKPEEYTPQTGKHVAEAGDEPDQTRKALYDVIAQVEEHQ